MKPTDDVQTEDKAGVNELRDSVTDPAVEMTPKKSFIDRAIPWVIVTVVFFLIGAATVYFTLYQKQTLELKTVQAELSESTNNLTAVGAKLDALIDEHNNVLADLAAAQTSIEEKNAALAKAEQNSVIYKFQADVNAARVALLKLDPASSRQALNFVMADLAALEKTEIDANALSGFKARIEEANANLETDPQKALGALDTLYSNLLLLVNNL
ncbi:MAG: Uncharacterized protein FD147_2145 [Chloroflexi bacterium]|nr:MAG: Uncharacterized protein FD147_2145 [Chloroflexota bacterium]MBA4376687.1 hypothetical protein [Anaerolinea sp.]